MLARACLRRAAAVLRAPSLPPCPAAGLLLDPSTDHLAALGWVLCFSVLTLNRNCADTYRIATNVFIREWHLHCVVWVRSPGVRLWPFISTSRSGRGRGVMAEGERRLCQRLSLVLCG